MKNMLDFSGNVEIIILSLIGALHVSPSIQGQSSRRPRRRIHSPGRILLEPGQSSAPHRLQSGREGAVGPTCRGAARAAERGEATEVETAGAGRGGLGLGADADGPSLLARTGIGGDHRCGGLW